MRAGGRRGGTGPNGAKRNQEKEESACALAGIPEIKCLPRASQGANHPESVFNGGSVTFRSAVATNEKLAMRFEFWRSFRTLFITGLSREQNRCLPTGRASGGESKEKIKPVQRRAAPFPGSLLLHRISRERLSSRRSVMHRSSRHRFRGGNLRSDHGRGKFFYE